MFLLNENSLKTIRSTFVSTLWAATIKSCCWKNSPPSTCPLCRTARQRGLAGLAYETRFSRQHIMIAHWRASKMWKESEPTRRFSMRHSCRALCALQKATPQKCSQPLANRWAPVCMPKPWPIHRHLLWLTVTTTAAQRCQSLSSPNLHNIIIYTIKEHQSSQPLVFPCLCVQIVWMCSFYTGFLKAVRFF